MLSWQELLAQSGHRITEPRRTVMKILLDSDIPLSPQEILDQGQELHKRLGLVTIYRTLELFESLELVCRVHLQDGCHGYLPIAPGHRHILLCKRCGRAVEFPGYDDLDGMIERVEERTGYKVNDHLLQLYGLCPECNQHNDE